MGWGVEGWGWGWVRGGGGGLGVGGVCRLWGWRMNWLVLVEGYLKYVSNIV